jgi:hypothetical protein
MINIAGGASKALPPQTKKEAVDPTNDVVQYDATGDAGSIHASAQYQIPCHKQTAEAPNK